MSYVMIYFQGSACRQSSLSPLSRSRSYMMGIGGSDAAVDNRLLMPKSRISPTPSINSIREDPVMSSNSSSSASSKCQINQMITEDFGALDLDRSGIMLPAHLRNGVPVLSGVKSRTSFKVKKKKFSVTKKYTEEWTVVKDMTVAGYEGENTGMGQDVNQKDGAEYRGWLLKWTNYIKGYRQRWFVLSNGLLSYYRSQAEMAHTCRGTINLAGANLESEDSCNFVISNGGAQVFHLRARSEVDRQRWITALELAKDRANKIRAEVDDEDDFVVSPETTATVLRQKLDQLNTYQNLVNQHGLALQQAISQVEDSSKLRHLTKEPQVAALIKKTAEFRIASTSMLKACSEFVTHAAHHEKEWQMAKQQQERLEETVESLARQHISLEKAMNKSKRNLADGNNNAADYPGGEGVVGIFDSDDDEEDFFDAMDISTPGSAPAAVAADSGFLTPDPVNNGEGSMPHDTQNLQVVAGTRKRRMRINDKPNDKANLWNIMKNCIGKELSKIPMPVNFNEPISFLQRLTEDMEYSELLNRAADASTTEEALCFLAALAVSAYATTSCRTSKPFNPLLGETYEFDRMSDLGWRSIAEQVSHHPPISALHVESARWTYYHDFSMTSKFRGKYLQIFPIGTSHCIFKETGHHFTWNKVCTTVHNIIVGKLWVDQSGEITLKEHTTGATGNVKFHPYSYFSRDVPRRITGGTFTPDGEVKYALKGTWDQAMEYSKVLAVDGDTWDTGPPRTVWVKNPPLENAERIYHFTKMACELNEPEEGVAPTDSRNRPDQRLMEAQNFPDANLSKVALEEAQRERRRQREALALAEGPEAAKYTPKWFVQTEDEIQGSSAWRYNHEYWEHKATQDWEGCIRLYDDPIDENISITKSSSFGTPSEK